MLVEAQKETTWKMIGSVCHITQGVRENKRKFWMLLCLQHLGHTSESDDFMQNRLAMMAPAHVCFHSPLQ